MPFGDQVSRPEQSPSSTPAPPAPPLSPEDFIREDKRAREMQGMWPTPRQVVEPRWRWQRDPYPGTPVDDLAISRDERKAQFPEIFTPPRPKDHSPLEKFKQRMDGIRAAFDPSPFRLLHRGVKMDIQTPYNSGLPIWNIGRP